MAPPRVDFIGLPTKLILDILKELGLNDVFSVIMLSRYFHRSFFDYWFDRQYTEHERMVRAELTDEAIAPMIPLVTCWSLLRHALNTDSQRIMGYIRTHRKLIELDEPLTVRGKEYKEKNTYLKFAICEDAPIVAAWLMETGIQTIHGLGEDDEHPEFEPLCLTLSKGNASTQEELNVSLTIACTHGCTRIAKLLLSRGADPSAYNPEGLNALHFQALASGYRTILVCGPDMYRSWKSWRDAPIVVQDMITTLIEYGSNIRSQTQTTHTDEGSQTCLVRSECTHRGETVIHLAAMKYNFITLSVLVKHGADIHAPDSYGHTALYRAIEYRRDEAFEVILTMSADNNPIVYTPTRSTALHIACRFGRVEAIIQLLGDKASANAVDSRGYTPLHEVLGHVELKQADVLTALLLLKSYRADLNLVTIGPSIQELAESHPRKEVRDMFEIRRRKRKRPGSGRPGKAGASFPDHEPPFRWSEKPPSRDRVAATNRVRSLSEWLNTSSYKMRGSQILAAAQTENEP